MGAHGSCWSPEEDRLLKSLIAKGLSFREIASYLPGRTAGAIQKRLYQRGLIGLRRSLTSRVCSCCRERFEARKGSRSTLCPDCKAFRRGTGRSRKKRECLRCGKLFVSAGKFNRLCANCRDINSRISPVVDYGYEINRPRS